VRTPFRKNWDSKYSASSALAAWARCIARVRIDDPGSEVLDIVTRTGRALLEELTAGHDA
jgi:hypothetical protein